MNVHLLAARKVLCLSPKRPGKYQETSPNHAFEETCPGQKFQIFNSLLKGIPKKKMQHKFKVQSFKAHLIYDDRLMCPSKQS